ncbi:Protein croquemort [Chionoecetes opilio]|uniref:Protein croquemort n=1 Tax=Chionoecetes opilio TaxID=41210 RepID=A0A8J4Y4R4_CHIOP|nr:Protein croquemort [Chionoecetes opilio]
MSSKHPHTISRAGTSGKRQNSTIGTSEKRRNESVDQHEEGGDDAEAVTPTLSRFRPLRGCEIAVVVVAALAMVLGVTMLAGGYHALLNYALRQELAIKEGSRAYGMWKSTPVPLSLRLHVFNLTNPEEVKEGAKPILQEVGPYVWREYHEKHNVSFHDNATVTYLQQRWWVWDQEASGGLSQEDTIITLNTIPVASTYSMRNSPLSLYFLDKIFKITKEQLTVTTTARKLLFDGVQDPLLDWAQANIVAKNGSYHFLMPFLKDSPVAQFEKFAWFYKRNLSLTYDGVFNMMTGQDTLDNLGRIDNWDGLNSTSFYTPPCNEVTGSAGEMFSPHLSRQDQVFFSSDLCMSAKLFFKEEVRDAGLSAYRYWGTNHTFANGSTVPGNECYCVSGTCAPMGLLNAESCRMGAPAFVSFPHFYAGDPFLLDGVDGLAPDEKNHSFYLDVVPGVGVPAAVSVKLQINIHLTPNPSISMLSKVPEVYLPMLWFEVQANMTPDLASQMKTLLFFLTSPVASVVVWAVLVGMAVLAVLVVVVLAWRRNSTAAYQQVS